MRSGCLTLSVKLTAVESAFLAAVFPFLVFEFAPVLYFCCFLLTLQFSCLT